MNVWSFYDAEGRIKPWHFCGPSRLLAANTPAGCTAIEGRFDHTWQRVANGQVVEFQPPKPEAMQTHDWQWDSRQWLKVLTFKGRQAEAVAGLSTRIAAIEGATDRFVRELAISHGGPAATRMQAIEEAITPLRLAINAVEAAQTDEELAAALKLD